MPGIIIALRINQGILRTGLSGEPRSSTEQGEKKDGYG